VQLGNPGNPLVLPFCYRPASFGQHGGVHKMRSPAEVSKILANLSAFCFIQFVGFEGRVEQTVGIVLDEGI